MSTHRIDLQLLHEKGSLSGPHRASPLRSFLTRAYRWARRFYREFVGFVLAPRADLRRNS